LTYPTTGVLGRARTAQTNLNAFLATPSGPLENINTQLSSIKTAIPTISDLIDPTKGVFAGMNCSLLGEDFTRIKNVMCGNFFSMIYLNRLAMGIGGWGLLFSLCCFVCTGVRHYKHG
jgi:hypothetical protein